MSPAARRGLLIAVALVLLMADLVHDLLHFFGYPIHGALSAPWTALLEMTGPLAAALLLTTLALRETGAAGRARAAAQEAEERATAAHHRLTETAEAMAQKSTLLEATFAAMTQGIVVWSADGRLLTWNRRYEALLDLPPDFLTTGLHADEFLRRMALEGEFGAGDLDDLVAQRHALVALDGRFERTRPNGMVLEILISHLDDGALLMTYTDITAPRQVEAALRESEERFRQLSDAATDCIIVHEDGTIVDINRAALAMTGYSAEELIGRPIITLVAPEDHGKGLKRMADRSQTRFEITGLRADGSRYVVGGETRYVPYRGRTVAIVSVHDITAYRDAEAQLRRAKEQAEQASQAKSDFLRMISHEIRTPLNGVLGMIGVLLDGHLSEQQRTYAATARESGEALLAILNDILDLSKMEAGKLELEPAGFDLVELVEGTMELLSPRAAAKGIGLAAAVPATLPAALRGDAGRLRQVLLNLAGNAVKFTEDGGVAVTVASEGLDGQGRERVRFEVTDTGVGIPPDAHPHLFEEFTQAAPILSRRYGGTGLGLAISRRLVDLMGGSIGFDSAPGHGSRFWFTVPLEPQPGGALPAAPPLAGRRVLLVAPCPLNRATLRLQIASWGAEVAEAPDAAAALRAGPVDVALLDTVANGAAALADALREAGAKRVVLLAEVGPAPHRAPPGIDATLVKPPRQARLLAALDGNAAPPEPALPAARPAPRPNGRRLLLVEDSPTNQMVATAFLKAAGYRIDVAANGLEGVEAVRTVPYDLVLMDIAMPEMDGLSATRTIRALPPPAGARPIIAMTADTMEGDRERCLAAGMNDHVGKPVDRARLLEVVERWLPPEPVAPSADAEDGPAPDTLDDEVLAQLARDLDPELLADVIRQFLEETRERVERIAGAEADATALAQEAHTLKSTAATFGAQRLSAAARELEMACRGHATAEIRTLRRQIPRLTREAAEAYRVRGVVG
ncbi:ATP-binding protein [Azospirillum sp. TSO22-1]|uniref:hybrid sensor histidine kinase/response regulator n=1 Tax=Azospirillum sp. TSO22-1 TaxID=716789 RepID=UPI000D64EF74|nr:ATP-binding protein [Azospirillum sp. TSO22-1]